MMSGVSIVRIGTSRYEIVNGKVYHLYGDDIHSKRSSKEVGHDVSIKVFKAREHCREIAKKLDKKPTKEDKLHDDV